MKNVIDVRCSHCNGIRQIEKSKLSTFYGKKIKFKCKKCNSDNVIAVNAELLNKQNDTGFKTVVLNRETATEKETKIAKIEVMSNGSTGRQVVMLNLGENIIGRKVSSDDINKPENKRLIITDDKKMSRLHCKIFVRQHDGKYDYFLSDNSSTNGTFYLGNKLSKHDEVNLDINREIKIGSTILKLVT